MGEGTQLVFDPGLIAVLIAIIGQTSVLSVWLGRLSQRVQDIKEDIDDSKQGNVAKDQCALISSSLSRRLDLCEESLKGLERRHSEGTTNARGSV